MFNLKNKRIAIFGLGVSGLSALSLVKALGGNGLAINQGTVDSWAKTPGVLDIIDLKNCFSESDSETKNQLSLCDLVILSPGIPRDHELLVDVHKKNIPVWGEIELAYRFLDHTKALSTIIGITGTNGKTTTTTFLGEMIEGAGKSVFVGGNIGIPFCDYALSILKGQKKSDFILLELSSFQLESIFDFHVNIAIMLNLYQNHGERYTSIEEYGRSKFFITNHFTKTDTLIYAEDFPLINNWAKNEVGECKKIGINTKLPSLDYDLSKFKLPGIHNKVNLNFIVEAAKIIGLKREFIQDSINSFKGVHHRIEYVDHLFNLEGFKAFNDAKSTNWDATITAVTAMEDYHEKVHLIIGGKKRGHGDSILPYLDFLKSHVFCFYLIGEMSEEIKNELPAGIHFIKTDNLEKTLIELRQVKSVDRGIILFSPGFPSFDQFTNYVHRGESFVKLLTNRL